MNTKVQNPEQVLELAAQASTQAQTISELATRFNSNLSQIKSNWTSTTQDATSYTAESEKVYKNLNTLSDAINTLASLARAFAQATIEAKNSSK